MDGASNWQTKKAQTIPEAVRALFKNAVKALTRHEDEPKPVPRRKSGETDKGFSMAVRAIMRRVTEAAPPRGRRDAGTAFGAAAAAIMSRVVQIPAAFFDAATEHLSETLDLLNQWNDEDLTADFDDGFANDHNDNSLNL